MKCRLSWRLWFSKTFRLSDEKLQSTWIHVVVTPDSRLFAAGWCSRRPASWWAACRCCSASCWCSGWTWPWAAGFRGSSPMRPGSDAAVGQQRSLRTRRNTFLCLREEVGSECGSSNRTLRSDHRRLTCVLEERFIPDGSLGSYWSFVGFWSVTLPLNEV